MRNPDGLSTIAFQPGGAGRIGAIYVVRNPETLKALPLAATSPPSAP